MAGSGASRRSFTMPISVTRKFGRVEGQGLDKVLNGWAKQDLPDDDLLQRGMDLIEGLYESLA